MAISYLFPKSLPPSPPTLVTSHDLASQVTEKTEVIRTSTRFYMLNQLLKPKPTHSAFCLFLLLWPMFLRLTFHLVHQLQYFFFFFSTGGQSFSLLLDYSQQLIKMMLFLPLQQQQQQNMSLGLTSLSAYLLFKFILGRFFSTFAQKLLLSRLSLTSTLLTSLKYFFEFGSQSTTFSWFLPVLLVTHPLPPLLVLSHITKLLNFESLQVQVLGLFTFPSILTSLLAISSSLLALNAIYILIIPEVLSLAWCFPQNAKLVYLLAYSTSPCGCLVGISKSSFPKLRFQLFPPHLSAYRILHLNKQHHSSICSDSNPWSHHDFFSHHNKFISKSSWL